MRFIQYRLSIKAITPVILAMAVIAFSFQMASAQPSDFFSNTQSTDKRAGSGAAIVSPGTVATNNPGFNPCTGTTTTRSAAGACVQGATPIATLLSADNLGTIFQQAGPGAITDNLFGKVTAVLATPSTFTTCGVTAADINTPIALADVLNCGNVRITPATQGMNIPTFPGTNSLTAVLSGSANLNGDFCRNGGTDCVSGTQIVGAHTGTNMVNTFVWNPTTAAVVTPIACAAGVSADAPRFCVEQIMEQVTALDITGIGTLPAPGANDQRVRVEAIFATPTTNVLATMPPPFNVTIAMAIADPDLSGSGAAFTQTIGSPAAAGATTFGTSGLTFSHNADPDGAGPLTTQIFSCTAQTSPLSAVGCASYPTGVTQTAGTQPADIP